jgi:uncharacterized protein YndB with AHSA1/START domain
MTKTATESIVHDIVLRHPPERVWRALTESASLSSWLMPTNIQAKVGHEFTFTSDPVPPYWDGVVHCKVLEVDPPRRLVYTWDGMQEMQTLITFMLERVPEGTLLRLEHSGFDLSRPMQKMAYDSMLAGWASKGMGDALRRVLDGLA